MGVRVLHVDRDYVEIPLIKNGTARAVVWPGMGAKHATFHYVVMDPGQENVPHVHPRSEDVIFILQGTAVVSDLDRGIDHPVRTGNVILVEAGSRHTVRVTGDETYIGCGGPVPHDLAMYRRAGLVR